MKKATYLNRGKPLYILLLCISPALLAAEKIEGSFSANQACDAYTSFNKQNNPGNVKLTPGSSYQAIETNKANNWDWIRINVPEAGASQQRWVARSCGQVSAGQARMAASNTASSANTCSTPNLYDSYVLAMSWQPGFCEHPPQDNKPECAALNQGKLNITHLTLHGLWPNKSSCGTNYGNCAGAALNLSKSTEQALAPWMPNFYYSNQFGAYEWKKHGTCQERDDDSYFLLAKDLLQQVDQSAIGSYLKANTGKSIRVDLYQKHIASQLGNDVASRVQVVCTQGKYLQEIRLSLGKTLNANADLKTLTQGAPSMERFSSKCNDQIYIEAPGK